MLITFSSFPTRIYWVLRFACPSQHKCLLRARKCLQFSHDFIASDLSVPTNEYSSKIVFNFKRKNRYDTRQPNYWRSQVAEPTHWLSIERSQKGREESTPLGLELMQWERNCFARNSTWPLWTLLVSKPRKLPTKPPNQPLIHPRCGRQTNYNQWTPGCNPICSSTHLKISLKWSQMQLQLPINDPREMGGIVAMLSWRATNFNSSKFEALLISPLEKIWIKRPAHIWPSRLENKTCKLTVWHHVNRRENKRRTEGWHWFPARGRK